MSSIRYKTTKSLKDIELYKLYNVHKLHKLHKLFSTLVISSTRQVHLNKLRYGGPPWKYGSENGMPAILWCP